MTIARDNHRYERWMRRALTVARLSPTRVPETRQSVPWSTTATATKSPQHTTNRERTGDPTAYAEVLALRQAGLALGTWHLDGCTLVTTLEPGVMAAGAIVLARLPRLVIGSWDIHNGAVCSQWDLVRDRRLNHYVEVYPEVLMAETDAVQNQFHDSSSALKP